jgi:RHS repeat-associated protein
VISYAYDANGNLTSLTPPERPGHVFRYDKVDQTSAYEPPPVAGTGNTIYEYNLDKDLTKITRPDGQTLTFDYDTGRRLQKLTLPTSKLDYAYDATSGKLSKITAQDATLVYTYNGALLTKTVWTGSVAGQVERAYDNDFRVTSLSVNGGNPITSQYDADSLLTKAGELTLTRSGQNGLLEGTGLVGVTDSYAYNGFGEVRAYEAKANAASLLRFEYTYNKLGRITQKKEIRGGTTAHTYDYGYDTAGRLFEVKRDGVVTASYGYDPNGNRTHLNGAAIAHYDDQDRLLDYQRATYQYSANGELQQKSVGSQVTKYSYDVLGNLRKVTLPNGTIIDYVIDGQNRRIGKKVDGTLVQGFLYQSQLRPIAELNGSGAVVSRFVYATGINVPDYMIKGGVTYRILKDHLGSPRLVIDVATNTVAQEMEYDAFGNVTQDTNPGFQPFGFAGGLYDRDTKLVRFGARDYDAETGRWATKDPISFSGGDPNLYSFVKNNPLKYIDPRGLWGLGWNAGVEVSGGVLVPNTPFPSGGVQLSGGKVTLSSWPSEVTYVSYGGGLAILPTYTDYPPIPWCGPGGEIEPSVPFGTAVGAYAGLSFGITITSANTPEELEGPSLNITANAFIISIQVSKSDASTTVSFSFGPGFGASVSVLPANTTIRR